MTEQAKKYLSDILLAISLIDDFTRESSDFNIYDSDPKTQSAVERQLAIIGEAINKLRKTAPSLHIENARQIISFRNRLIHSYDRIDNSIVWVILTNYLPGLKSEIENL